jgi:uncharacterized membrane protein
MATSELAAQPVSFYALVFFLVNLTYCALIWELVREEGASAGERRAMRRRSLVTLGLFAGAAVVALRLPILGLAICIGCLVTYLRPKP